MKKAILTIIILLAFSTVALAEWGTMPNLLKSRADAYVAFDGDGDLYVMGGYFINLFTETYLNTGEKFTFGRGWENTSVMPYPMSAGDAVFYDGKMYLPGGYGGVPLKKHLIYDVDSDTWTQGAEPPDSREGYTFDLVGDKMYLIGGGARPSSSYDNCWEYDPAASTWTVKSPMTQNRRYHGSAVIDGLIYVFGGIHGTGIYIQSGEVYDPAADTWDDIDDMPVSYHAGASGAMDGQAWACHGLQYGLTVADCHQYDPIGNTWTSGDDGNRARDHVGSTSSPLYVVGGLEHNLTGDKSLSAVEGWDFADDDDDDDDDNDDNDDDNDDNDDNDNDDTTADDDDDAADDDDDADSGGSDDEDNETGACCG